MVRGQVRISRQDRQEYLLMFFFAPFASLREEGPASRQDR